MQDEKSMHIVEFILLKNGINNILMKEGDFIKKLPLENNLLLPSEGK